MTCYNTCAYPGCYKRIPYEIGKKPDKHCPEHQKQMDERTERAVLSK